MTTKATSKSAANRSRSRSPLKIPVRSKRLLVSNVPFATTFTELKDLFKDKIGMCGRLEFIERNGKFTGNATMEFKTLEGAQKAVDTMHKYDLNGREIIVREESNKDRDRLNLNSNSKRNSVSMMDSNDSLSQLVNDIQREGPITNSIFISNLDYSLTWQKLKDLFKSAGRVRHVDIKTDDDGKSRGFCIVEFETPEEAILAIHLFNNKLVGKREMRVRMDKSGKALSGRLNLSKFVDSDYSESSGLNPNARNIFDDLLGTSSSSRKNPQALKALDELLTLAKMFESPSMRQSIPENDRNFMFGGSIRNYDDMPRSSLRNDNFNSQNFESRIMGNKSSEYNTEYSGKSREYPPTSSRISDFNEGSRTTGFNNSGSSTGFDMNMVEEILLKMKNSGNLDQSSLMGVISNVMKRSPDSYSSTHKSISNSRSDDFLSGKQSSTLLIKNIPFSYSWRDLKVSFAQVPGIDQIDILRDDFDRSKGVGIVRFESSSDANRCKNLMDGTLLDGRPIHIEFSNSF